jgi:peroxiredoxin (alkyl hydroperoxide reductase subunit C)
MSATAMALGQGARPGGRAIFICCIAISKIGARAPTPYLTGSVQRCTQPSVQTQEFPMLGVGEKFPNFKVVGVKPGFNRHEENGVSAFEDVTQDSFPGKWKVIFFYPKDFTFVCPTEIAEFARLNKDFADRDTIVLGGSTDNEHSKLGWRRDHADLDKLPIWQFADNSGKLARALGVLNEDEGVALRATFVVDPHNIVQHVYVTNLNVGRAPADTLRVVDALQTDELCPCNRAVGGDTLKAA